MCFIPKLWKKFHTDLVDVFTYFLYEIFLNTYVECTINYCHHAQSKT